LVLYKKHVRKNIKAQAKFALLNTLKDLQLVGHELKERGEEREVQRVKESKELRFLNRDRKGERAEEKPGHMTLGFISRTYCNEKGSREVWEYGDVEKERQDRTIGFLCRTRAEKGEERKEEESRRNVYAKPTRTLRLTAEHMLKGRRKKKRKARDGKTFLDSKFYSQDTRGKEYYTKEGRERKERNIRSRGFTYGWNRSWKGEEKEGGR
jgi:hypothetical protein